MARIIGVVSGKGGVGKTVVAINLAAALHKWYRKKVLLVDCNITTSHIGLYLGLYSTPVTLNDALRGSVSIKKTIYEHSCGINVIPASLKLEDLRDINWEVVKNKLSGVFNDYDFIILDSSPGFGKESLVTLGACREALLVTNPIVHSVADLMKCKELAIKLGVNPLGIVLNMVRNRSYEMSSKEIMDMIELNIICSIPFDEAVMRSTMSKNPVINSNYAVSRHFRRLASFLTNEDSVQERTGLIAKISNMFKWIYFQPNK